MKRCGFESYILPSRLFSSVFFFVFFTTLRYKTPIVHFEWRRQSDFGVSKLIHSSHYFHSPKSSPIIKSKIAATIRTETSFRPPKIRVQAMWWRKIQSEIEVYDWLWTSNAAPVACLFLLKIMLFYDEILLSGQPFPGVQNTKTNDDIKIRRKRFSCVMESSTFFDQSWAAIITTYSQSSFLKLGSL